ncbi:hypothetical protein BDZ91DRAFT_745580 [Kalaharituber pfeilii]|nr:hypothetical protein BDZ91DRAFT_745580 [Kalaharituber pfeilii]
MTPFIRPMRISSPLSSLSSTFTRYRTSSPLPFRSISTLPGHPHIQIHPHPTIPDTHLLTLLPAKPAIPILALGTTSSLPPTINSFTPNQTFLSILHSVISEHCTSDPSTQQSVTAFVSSSTHSLFQHNRRAAPTGGWVHISDERNPPDWGRIPDPEDIFGSVEVDAKGNIREGSYQPCLGYRIWTRNGIMQLSPYLREKLVEKLKDEERKIQIGSSRFASL